MSLAQDYLNEYADERTKDDIDRSIFWKTIEGAMIKITDMETSHIKNCINMLERNGFISKKDLVFYLFGPEPSGDMAIACYEQECDAVFKAPVSESLDSLREELKRREA